MCWMWIYRSAACNDQLKPVDTAHHPLNKTFNQKDLKTCTHMFLRDDKVRTPLKSPYDGLWVGTKETSPFIWMEGKSRMIDRVKAAYTEAGITPLPWPSPAANQQTTSVANDLVRNSSTGEDRPIWILSKSIGGGIDVTVTFNAHTDKLRPLSHFHKSIDNIRACWQLLNSPSTSL